MVLPFAVCSTELGCGTTLRCWPRVSCYGVQCLVLTKSMVLPGGRAEVRSVRRAREGVEAAAAGKGLRVLGGEVRGQGPVLPYAVSGTDKVMPCTARGRMPLRLGYAMSGTDVAYGAIRKRSVL
eukprot:811516-Rhodomonas_salina.2